MDQYEYATYVHLPTMMNFNCYSIELLTIHVQSYDKFSFFGKTDLKNKPCSIYNLKIKKKQHY